MVEKISVHEGRKRGAKQWLKICEKGEPLKLDMQRESHNLSYKRQCIDVRVCAKYIEAPSSSYSFFLPNHLSYSHPHISNNSLLI